MLKFEYELSMNEPGSTYSNLKSEVINTGRNARDLLIDRYAKLPNGNFDDLDEADFESQPSKLTKSKVKHFSVKSLPSVGPYGLYTKSNNDVILKIPIDKIGTLPTIKDVQFSVSGDFIKYTFNGDMSMYEFVRVIFEQDGFSHEFIVRDNEGEIFKPSEMAGDYSISCVGYNNEIKFFSEPSEPINLSL